jgi:hypothetical protein
VRAYLARDVCSLSTSQRRSLGAIGCWPIVHGGFHLLPFLWKKDIFYRPTADPPSNTSHVTRINRETYSQAV